MGEKWCAVCGSRHDLGPPCPGVLEASGPERFGWRVALEGDHRTDEVAVLVAPSDEFWRARVLTLPNMLWSAPGQRGMTLKFVGHSAKDVEETAKKYIRLFATRRGMTVRPATSVKKQALKADGVKGNGENQRMLYTIPIKFGEQLADRVGLTGDLSNAGLFIATKQPLPQGRRLRLVLEIDQARLPLQGTVIWVRSHQEEGREPGMGIQLHGTPALYRHYVARLGEGAKAAAKTEASNEAALAGSGKAG